MSVPTRVMPVESTLTTCQGGKGRWGEVWAHMEGVGGTEGANREWGERERSKLLRAAERVCEHALSLSLPTRPNLCPASPHCPHLGNAKTDRNWSVWRPVASEWPARPTPHPYHTLNLCLSRFPQPPTLSTPGQRLSPIGTDRPVQRERCRQPQLLNLELYPDLSPDFPHCPHLRHAQPN